MKLYLDPGHGGSDPGALGNGLKEKDITLDIAKRIHSILVSNYKQVDVRMSRTKDITKSLWQRTNEANNWGADYFVSIHCNAFNGNANGYEDFVYSSLSAASRTSGLQAILHQGITKLNGLKNRGKKKANFHVLRETKMPAFLSENGFIDNKKDAALMKQTRWREKVAQGHANGIAKAFHLERKQQNKSNQTAYQVIVGSFKNKNNAKKRLNFLKSKGMDAVIQPSNISGNRLFRVQAGTFANKTNAKKHLDAIKKTGIDGFIL